MRRLHLRVKWDSKRGSKGRRGHSIGRGKTSFRGSRSSNSRNLAWLMAGHKACGAEQEVSGKTGLRVSFGVPVVNNSILESLGIIKCFQSTAYKWLNSQM